MCRPDDYPPYPEPNPGWSCSVCGHIAAHDDRTNVIEDRACSTCGYCMRKRVEDMRGTGYLEEDWDWQQAHDSAIDSALHLIDKVFPQKA